MKQFILYGHGGAYNHGAEAIIKCTVGHIKNLYPDSKIILSTHFKDQDIEFKMPVDDYCERDINYLPLDKDNKGLYNHLIYKETLDKIAKDTICLSVGGDNYCYNNWHRWMTIHEKAISIGAKSILWSCSIEPDMINDEMIDTLRSHDLITARESITYQALKAKGLNNVELCSDIAFLLEPKKVQLPDNFNIGNTIGINLSPLILRRVPDGDELFKNIIKLIQYIIHHTEMNVALIPHVLMSMDNDFELLKAIYDELDDKTRVSLISAHISAAEYKYIISQCRFFIAARTHASIAAYSSSIPTIALSYSVKAMGIAKDLGFEDYVIPLEDLVDFNKILHKFNSLLSAEQELKNTLQKNMSKYKENAKINIALS